MLGWLMTFRFNNFAPKQAIQPANINPKQMFFHCVIRSQFLDYSSVETRKTASNPVSLTNQWIGVVNEEDSMHLHNATPFAWSLLALGELPLWRKLQVGGVCRCRELVVDDEKFRCLSLIPTILAFGWRVFLWTLKLIWFLMHLVKLPYFSKLHFKAKGRVVDRRYNLSLNQKHLSINPHCRLKCKQIDMTQTSNSFPEPSSPIIGNHV